jgi:hypothetical protein
VKLDVIDMCREFSGYMDRHFWQSVIVAVLIGLIASAVSMLLACHRAANCDPVTGECDNWMFVFGLFGLPAFCVRFLLQPICRYVIDRMKASWRKRHE